MNYFRYFVGVVSVGFGLAALPSQAADLAHGKELYAECEGCHALRETLVGPQHCWVVGRAAGKVPGFEYSGAMKASGLKWDEKTLDEFLVSPFTYVSGTLMGYAGLDLKKDREDLIAYLKQVTTDPANCGDVDKHQ